jgi:hypothetical protein
MVMFLNIFVFSVTPQSEECQSEFSFYVETFGLVSFNNWAIFWNLLFILHYFHPFFLLFFFDYFPFPSMADCPNSITWAPCPLWIWAVLAHFCHWWPDWARERNAHTLPVSTGISKRFEKQYQKKGICWDTFGAPFFDYG